MAARGRRVCWHATLDDTKTAAFVSATETETGHEALASTMSLPIEPLARCGSAGPWRRLVSRFGRVGRFGPYCVSLLFLCVAPSIDSTSSTQANQKKAHGLKLACI